MNDYLRENAYWDVEYLKIFELADGPPDHPVTQGTTTVPPPPDTCAETWFPDTDCDGADILNKQVDDFGDCCKLCSETAGCGAFTHNVFDGHDQATCYLKKSCTEKKGKRGCSSGIPANITPAPPPAPPGYCGSNYLEHTDCAGADISDKPADSADDCCSWCSETQGCTAFVHSMVDGHGAPHCYLKESCDESQQSWSDNAVAGVGIVPDSTRRRRSTTPPPSPPPSPGCCSWADNDECGDTTDYCKSNAIACDDCGGHWVPDEPEPAPAPVPPVMLI